MSNPHAKAFFHLLHAQKAQLQAELCYPLDWEELPEGKDTRISAPLNDTDPENRADWPRQHEWLVARLNDFYRVFAGRVKSLIASDWASESAV